MAKSTYDGVIEAVHYGPDGQVDWVRAYLRRGSIWSDWIIMTRQDLVQQIKAGRKMMLGSRVEYMAGTFEVSSPVKVANSDGKEVLTTSDSGAKMDLLEGAPVI